MSGKAKVGLEASDGGLGDVNARRIRSRIAL